MATDKFAITGLSLVGSQTSEPGSIIFHAVNPATGAELEPLFYSASETDIDRAGKLAADAFPAFAALTGRDRAGLMRRIADELARIGAELVQRANLETGLPLPRLEGELNRTTGQFRLFAELLEEGSWVNARIDEALPDRKPLLRPDLRSMLRPLGPVVIFGASNFPLAFSVAGGDTASALAAGNPVVVKAHPAHPGTSELAARAVCAAVHESGLPSGVFSLLFDNGIHVGVSLVQHPAIKAVAFTGSATGGQALMKLAAARPEPIPCYAEMGSTNPVFILPGAMRERSGGLARGLQASFTQWSGQVCTKPGMVFMPQHGSEPFVEMLRTGVSGLSSQRMLTRGIASNYGKTIQQRINKHNVELLAGEQSAAGSEAAVSAPAIFRASLHEFLEHPELGEEVFGPTTLLVPYGSADDLLEVARKLHGHLTATIHGTEEDLAGAGDLIRILETKAGRVIFNGFPTGVEVSHAMVHGGPFPATSDGRSTSVGTQAIYRFTRPVCYQNFADSALPAELRRANLLGILRLVNGKHTREPQQ
jgi:NADP-dependent aldehyde dehydrogenase